MTGTRYLGLIITLLLSVSLSAQKVTTSSFKITPDESCPVSEEKKALKYLEEGKNRKNSKEERLEALRKAVEADGDCAEANYLLGLELLRTALSKGAGFKNARKYLERTVEICPDFHFEPYYFLGSLALGSAEYDLSVKYYEKYYELSSSSIDPLDDDREDIIRLDYEFAKFFADAYANPVPFNPVKVGSVCTDVDEFLPFISPDNENMMFTRRYEIESHVKASVVSEKTQYVEKFVQSKLVNGAFEEGEPMPSPFNENKQYHYGGASVTIDNKHLFLTICVPASMGKMNCDIYTADLTYGPHPKTGVTGYHWSELRNMGDNINTPDGWEAQPSISSDGNRLYFASFREGSQGMDIYYTEKDESGQWSAAVNAGAPINTEYNDKTPFMHSDSKTLYFASDGHLGFGGLDVFFVKQNDDGTWSKPVNLGHPINTPEDEQAFAVSTDGKRVYYSGKDPNDPRSIEIFNFELHKAARPEKVVFVKGELKQPSGDPVKNAVVELKSMQSKNITKVDVDPNDGKYAAVVTVKADENVVMNVKAENMAFQSKLIEVVDEDEAEKPKRSRTEAEPEQEVNTFQEISLEVAEVKQGGVYRINDIYYATNSSTITEKSKAILDEFAIYLLENENIRIAIHGHTDNVGKADVNLVLSADRAFSVKQYLETQGVAGDRIQYKGFGETVPFTSNDNEAGRAANRRTEFLIVGT